MVALSPPTALAPPRRTRPAARHRDNRALELLEGSLSVRRIERSAPWLASLHRLSDGTLMGIGFCMLALSGLTLHWQARWSQSYARLEATQVLEHRLQEASALLEQHHLAAVKRPGWLVPTRSEKLIYLPPPAAPAPFKMTGLVLNRMQSHQIPAGY